MVKRGLVQALASLWLAGASMAAADEAVRIEHDGLTLNGRLLAGEAERPTLLIVHGTMAHHRMELIETLQTLLEEQGYGSLAVTLGLGVDDRQGMYDCAVPHRHRHGDALAEIDAWLDWLADQGRDRVVLLGHSRGGAQAALYLAEHDRPEVAGGVLLAPATFEESAVAKAYAAAGGGSLADRLATARAGGRLKGVRFLHCEQADVEPESFLSYYAPDPALDTPTLLARIEEPVLVVLAGADALVPDLAARLAAAPAGQATLVTVEGADHFFLDLHADEAAEAVGAFLENLP